MFPLLMIASRLAPVLKSVSGSGLSLKGKTKETTTRASAEKQADEVETVLDKKGKEHAVDSPTGKMIINMTKPLEEETPEMFGGMDLNKIKSALDEDSPLGMPDTVEGGVYKQIFEVNKMMLGSLQRIEGTLKLMLNLEYERALAFQQADVQQSLIEGDTDDDEDEEKGPGRFRRGLSAAGSMLGGAYSKAREFTPGTFTKLLGLGALIFAFNKYKDEIIAAMAGILSYFTDVYNVFKSDGIGAAFDKVLDDFMNIFMPKLFSVVDNIVGTLYDYVKETLFGASGSKRIRQEAGDASVSAKSMKTLTDKAIAGGDELSQMSFHEIGIMKGTESLSDADTRKLHESIKDHIGVMNEISKQSDGRIQWDTFPGFKFGKFAMENIDDMFELHPVASFMNANPVIDGVPHNSWEILNTINLDAMAGISRGMSEERADKIRNVLARKTEAYQKKAGPETMKALDAEYRALNPVEIPKIQTNQYVFDNYTNSTKALNSMATTGTVRSSSPSADFNPTYNVDNKKIVDAKEVHNHPMNAANINFTHTQLSRLNNGEAVFGF